ncbi:aromatic ring-hydroxylating oxygenase subunit alpha [Ramlibacter albus]|uniref:Rieske 2Fe-2S domain-containing protein n=1 Tax=Ramlibacter albus TaxID=2079448 RepID=A0A923M361_9BURK|nr:Rieske 2Fe-2S domain-containing protein [Ramlibacter albus]
MEQVDKAVKRELNYAAIVQDDRVHGSVYCDPAVFTDEMERIFYSSWVYVGHESEIPNPGDYVTRRIGRQPMILIRDTDSQVHLLHDRCPHRGNRLTQRDKGHMRNLVCSYHGWAFDARGQFLSMPAPASFPHGCENERHMRAASRVQTYGKFIFASLAATGESLEDHLGNARQWIDMLNGLSPTGRIRLDAGWMKHRIAGNWKGLAENQVDGYHLAHVHGSLLRANRDFTTMRDRSDESATRLRDRGHGHVEIDFAPDFRRRQALLGWSGDVAPERVPAYVAAMKEAYGDEEAVRRLTDGPPHAVVFPNLFLAEMNVMMIEPVGPHETIQHSTAVILEGGAEMNSRTLRRCEGALGPAGMLVADDAEIADLQRQGMASAQPEWLLLRRGMQSEVTDPDGSRSGDLKDETPQRGFWRHYRHVMSRACE